MGYADKGLQEFVKEQPNILRDERAAARQKEKDELQYKLQLEKAALEKDRLAQELHMQEMANAHELKMLEKKARVEIKSWRS